MSTDQLDLSISLAGGRRPSSDSGSGGTVGLELRLCSESKDAQRVYLWQRCTALRIAPVL
jgi:hypothetical protein